MRGRDDREGMALLTVLLLVAVVAVLAAAVLDDVRFSIRRAANVQGAAQARWFALGAEDLARMQIRRLADRDAARTSIQPFWSGAPLAFPLDDGGEMTATLRDGQACFNLNSVVDGSDRFLIRREQGQRQFAALARAVGTPDGEARRLAAVLTDWIDTDNRPLTEGAEDSAYAALPSPRRTAGALMAEPGELRGLLGMTPALYERLRPHVCALPQTGASPINPNTLTEAHWPLLVMLSDGALTAEQARAAILARPANGWDSVNAFWTQPVLAGLDVPPDVHDQVTLKTVWFELNATVRWGGAEVTRTTLLHDRGDGVRVAAGRWSAG